MKSETIIIYTELMFAKNNTTDNILIFLIFKDKTLINKYFKFFFDFRQTKIPFFLQLKFLNQGKHFCIRQHNVALYPTYFAFLRITN